jgi:hypothetical protein
MTSLESLKKLIETALGADKKLLPDSDILKIEEHIDEIVDIANSVIGIIDNKIEFGDLSKIGDVVEPLMTIASSFSEYKGEDKKRFVTEVVWLIYRAIDTYPDGNRNNINIPFVVGILERKIERAIIVTATSIIVDVIHRRLKKEVI